MPRAFPLACLAMRAACCPQAEPPTQLREALPCGGELVVDVAMWDACERSDRSSVSLHPATGGPVESVATPPVQLSGLRTLAAREDTAVTLRPATGRWRS